MAHYKRRSKRRGDEKMLPCGCCKDIRGNRQEPIPDGPCTGKKHSKRKAPKKDRCPVNRTHVWRTQIVEKPWYGSATRKDELKTCVHCGKQKSRYIPRPSAYRDRKKVLPKREVKLY